MDTPDTKTCNGCGEAKPLEDFNKRQAKCRPCEAEYGREYRAKNKARRAQGRKHWYEVNREENLAYQAKWREKNREYKREQDRLWLEANRDRKRAGDAAYREANREERAAYFKRRHELLKSTPAYQEQRAATKARRRARLAEVEHQPYARRQIYDRDGGHCKLCGLALEFKPKTFHIDHIVPIALGGVDTPANLQLTCPPCNQRKSARLEGQLRFAA